MTIGHVSNITLHRVRRHVNPDLVLWTEWLLTAVGRTADARAANERALALAANPAERELIARRLSS